MTVSLHKLFPPFSCFLSGVFILAGRKVLSTRAETASKNRSEDQEDPRFEESKLQPPKWRHAGGERGDEEPVGYSREHRNRLHIGTV